MKQRKPLRLAPVALEETDLVELGATSRRGEQELDEALKKYSNMGSNIKKMNAYETNMIFKTQPSPMHDYELTQVKASPR